MHELGCSIDRTVPVMPAERTRAADGVEGFLVEVFEGTDACFAPVLTVAEAAAHPHNVARGTYTVGSGATITASAAPRFLPLA